MDLLQTPKFSITLCYGTFSMVMYALVTVMIFTNSANFKGSFFKIFVVGFFMNLWTYGNSFVTLRIPQNTKINGSCSDFFSSHDLQHNDTIFPTSFFHMMHFHFAYTQYSFNTLMCLNRAMVVFFPLKCEIFWQKYFLIIVSVLFLLPFATTFNIYTHHSYYEYFPAEDYFAINTTYGKASIYAVLMPTLLFVTATNIFLNVLTFIKMLTMKKTTRRTLEINLLLMTFSVFVIDMFLSILSLFNYSVSTNSYHFLEIFMATETLQRLNITTQLLTPFASDFLTFSHPWLLIIFSAQIRKKIFSLCGLNLEVKSNNPTNVVRVKASSRGAWD